MAVSRGNDMNRAPPITLRCDLSPSSSSSSSQQPDKSVMMVMREDFSSPWNMEMLKKEEGYTAKDRTHPSLNT